MGQYQQWEVWKARVYHEDDKGYEDRPVVVVSEEELIVLSLKVTTHGHSGRVRPFEYQIQKIEEAGLEEGSVIQCDKYRRIKKGDMQDFCYGRLSATDIVLLQAMMKFHGL